MAYTTVQGQLPASSSTDMGVLSDTKRQLVDEMSEFTREGDRVNPTDSQLQLAEQLVRSNDRTRYAKIPFGDIVKRNQVSTIQHLCMYLIMQYFNHPLIYCMNY